MGNARDSAQRDGKPASFRVEGFADRTFPGTVIQVRQAPQFDVKLMLAIADALIDMRRLN